MSEPGFIENGVEVVLGETRCRSHPRTCAEVQAESPTSFRFCDFCIYGPPDKPTREVGQVGTVEEMNERIAAPERERAEKLRDAILSQLEQEEG